MVTADSGPHCGADGWTELKYELMAGMTDELEKQLAAITGSSYETLRGLGCGWSKAKQAFTLTLESPTFATAGFAYWSPASGRIGCQGKGLAFRSLRFSRLARPQRMVVATHFLDIVTLSPLGVVGLPNAGDSGPELLAFLDSLRKVPGEVAILQIGDHANIQAACSLAADLGMAGHKTRLVLPPAPYPSFGEWKRCCGVTKSMLNALIDKAPVLEPQVEQDPPPLIDHPRFSI